MSSGTLKIKIFDTNGTKLVSIPKSTISVGSASHCDIVLKHDSVLPEHVRGWIEGGRIWLQDMGGPSGTYLNGIRLPSLKPMLVRDLDIVKIGDCASNLSLEASFIRSPIVKPRAVIEESKVTEARPLIAKDDEIEKRREEISRLSREFAELKLQLQMARMDKAAEDEIHKETAKLRADLRKFTLERDALEETLQHLEKERLAKVTSLERELVGLRASAEKELERTRAEALSEIEKMKANSAREVQELKVLRESATPPTIQRDADWSRVAVHQFNEKLKKLGLRKAKAWSGKKMSKDMILEMEADLRAIFRDTIAMDDSWSTGNEQLTASRSQIRHRNNRDSKLKMQPWMVKRAGGILALGIFGFVLYTAKTHLMHRSPQLESKQTAPSRPLSGQRTVAALPPKRFEPKQTRGFKKTYTDNALYTTLFLEAELNAEFRSLWLAELEKAARSEWKIDRRVVARLNDKEFGLLQDLRRMRESINPQSELEGIQRMRDRELQFIDHLNSLLQKDGAEKYLKLKRNFFNRNQNYVIRR